MRFGKSRLDPVKCKDLQIAILKRQVAQERAEQVVRDLQAGVKAANDVVAGAMKALGLDPEKTYNIDYDKGVATIVEPPTSSKI